ncbi:MAG: FtsX-like permease family protein [Cyclobacteriaceae bacterium]
MVNQPPKLARKILLCFLRDDLAEEVLGDLEEKFYWMVKNKSLSKARLNYWYQVFNYIRPFAIRKLQSAHSNFYAMFQHNILISFRNFKKFKSSFLINLTGLSTVLASVLLISLWVMDELSFDKFHEKDSRLFEVMSNIPLGDGSTLTIGATPGLLAQALIEEMPEVEQAAVAASPMGGRGTKAILSVGDSRIKASELYVTSNYFSVFSFPLIQGDEGKVLSDKYSVVLSEELALSLFHTTENIIGKTVLWDRANVSGPYIVSGVFKKPPEHSSLQFDLLFTYEVFFEKYASNLESWGNSNPSTYVVLKEGTDVKHFDAKIRDFKKLKISRNPNADLGDVGTLFLQRFSEKYLYNRYENGLQDGGRISYVKLFSVIALFILTIACINFMNLSTAKASRRIKEIGIKKAIGADRKSLLSQFLGESMLMAFFSLIFAVLLVAVSLPAFNQITGKHIDLNFDSGLVLSVLGITLIIGLVAGSYPALYLSGFRPAVVLKGKMNTSAGESWVRRGLVVFQFTISIILIGSVLVVYNQIEFIQSKNLGYNKDNIVSFKKEGKLNEGLETFLLEIKKISGVVNASHFSHDLTGTYGSTSAIEWEGRGPGDRILFGNLEVGVGLIELMDFKMTEGRTFSEEFGSESKNIIFNESAIKAMGLTEPVGKMIKLWGEERQIIGVVRDFHFESLYEKVKPCFLQWYPDRRNILVKIRSGMEKETIERLQKFYQTFNEGLAFEYSFLDEGYQAMYAAEQRVAVLSRCFAGIAILISCLGLFGLAAFTVEKRTKEIGIRKVLGSSEFGIMYLLSIDFTKMVLVAIVIGLPASYFITQNWLFSFSYRINLEWWNFAAAGFMALFIAWFTVGIQTIKAAHVNPTECLKNE